MLQFVVHRVTIEMVKSCSNFAPWKLVSVMQLWSSIYRTDSARGQIDIWEACSACCLGRAGAFLVQQNLGTAQPAELVDYTAGATPWQQRLTHSNEKDGAGIIMPFITMPLAHTTLQNYH